MNAVYESEITLSRGTKGLGFNIRGGKDSPHVNGDTGIFITKIREVGAAYDNGQLMEGDRILEVNGRSLVNISHADAVNMFITSGEIVTMKVVHGAETKILNDYKDTYLMQKEKQSLDKAKEDIIVYGTLAGCAVVGIAGLYFLQKR